MQPLCDNVTVPVLKRLPGNPECSVRRLVSRNLQLDAVAARQTFRHPADGCLHRRIDIPVRGLARRTEDGSQRFRSVAAFHDEQPRTVEVFRVEHRLRRGVRFVEIANVQPVALIRFVKRDPHDVPISARIDRDRREVIIRRRPRDEFPTGHQLNRRLAIKLRLRLPDLQRRRIKLKVPLLSRNGNASLPRRLQPQHNAASRFRIGRPTSGDQPAANLPASAHCTELIPRPKLHASRPRSRPEIDIKPSQTASFRQCRRQPSPTTREAPACRHCHFAWNEPVRSTIRSTESRRSGKQTTVFMASIATE